MSEQSSEHPELKKLNSLLKNYKKSNNNNNNNNKNNNIDVNENNTTKDDQTKRNISLFRKSDKKEENRSISSEDDEGRVSSEQQPKKVQSQHPPPPRSLNTTAKNVVVMDGSDSNESSQDEEDDNNDNDNNNNNDTEIVNYDDQPSYHQEDQQDQQDNFSEFSNIDFPDDLPNISSRSSTPQSTHQSTPKSTHQSQNHHQQLPPPPSQQSTPQIHHQQMPLSQSQTFRVNRKSVPGKNYGISPLTVVTYNIWGNKHGQATRTVDVVNIILKGNKYVPDIVCLQEVTSKSFAILEKSLSATYHIFDVLERNNNSDNSQTNSNSNIPYSNVICVNRGTMEVVKDSITAYDFESQMGRKLVVCGVKHISTESTFYVLNTHLESFEENWSYRRAQLESILRLIKEEKMRNIILMGDFNITRPTEPTEVQLRLAEGYNDVWNEMGSPESLKYTYDTQTNEYARTKALQQSQQSSQSSKNQQSLLIKGRARMDRILYKFKDQKIVPTKIRLLGVTKPQPPSDHYGLLVEFMIKKAGQ